MTPAQLATRLAQMDWSACSLQHQLAVSAAVLTLKQLETPMPAHCLPIYSNVVALVPPTRPAPSMRHVTLLTLEGAPFATAGFLPGLASAPWDWIAETVAAEHECAEEEVGCEESEEGDLVTVRGEAAYRVAIGRNAAGFPNQPKDAC